MCVYVFLHNSKDQNGVCNNGRDSLHRENSEPEEESSKARLEPPLSSPCVHTTGGYNSTASSIIAGYRKLVYVLLRKRTRASWPFLLPKPNVSFCPRPNELPVIADSETESALCKKGPDAHFYYVKRTPASSPYAH